MNFCLPRRAAQFVPPEAVRPPPKPETREDERIEGGANNDEQGNTTPGPFFIVGQSLRGREENETHRSVTRIERESEQFDEVFFFTALTSPRSH